MKVYIAGPMRGLPDWNFPAFDAAETRWRAAGHQPFSPAQIDRVLQYGPADGSGNGGEGRAHLRHMIRLDIECILCADAVALLPGWERSRGAAVELALAQFLGLKVYDAVTMNEIRPRTRPWSCVEILLRPGDECTPGDWDECWRLLQERAAAAADAREAERAGRPDYPGVGHSY